jgi:hypothetical protein
MIKNILENVVYEEPRADLPIPPGMCGDCSTKESQDQCEHCHDLDDQ